jgi:hypothetical protein
LDRSHWDQSLGKAEVSSFAKALQDPNLHAPRTSLGVLTPTPHFMYVNDGIYIGFFDIVQIEHAVAASIEVIFLLLDPSDLNKWQVDKLKEMVIGPINHVLGYIINTRQLTMDTPADFLDLLRAHLTTTWGPHRRSFMVLDPETLAGQLGHVSFPAPWLKHLMPHLYQSLATALWSNNSHLISTSSSFCHALKQITQAATLPSSQASRLSSFYQAESAHALHYAKTRHFINWTLRAELNLICAVLGNCSIPTTCPISHLIDRTPGGVAFSDSSLCATG